MSTYIGKVSINGQSTAIGSTLFCTCNTAAGTPSKTVTSADFDTIIAGVTIHVVFTQGNTCTSGVKLTVGQTAEIDVAGSCICGAGDVISFTFDKNGSDSSTNWRWRVNVGGQVIPAATSTTPSAVSSTASVGSSDSYARADHVHNIVVGQGSNNGEITIAGQTVAVPGLGSAAFVEASDYLTTTAASNTYMPKSGGEFTGAITVPTVDANATGGTVVNKEYVTNALGNVLSAAQGMIFKGTLGATNGTVSALPSVYDAGWTYRIVDAGTYAGQQCEIGDLIIAVVTRASGDTTANTDWTVVQGNLDGTVIGPASSTANHIATFDGNSGKTIKDSGYTIGTSVPSGAVFTDTTYTPSNISAYTSHTLTNESGSSILASVTSGVLTLAPGIKFTSTTAVGSITASTNGASNT